MVNLHTMGNRIREVREKLGYTREQFAEMINISPRFCYDIEAGQKGVSLETLKNICQVLELPASYLLDLEDLDSEKYESNVFQNLMNRCPAEFRDDLNKLALLYVQSVTRVKPDHTENP